ncbi:hypothetical protein TERMP_00375 [Thermococcus barophilus MP]|uniref:Uncharacterized protein n=1 Tax=Thermococcus barophilus (strain DSM 11836 / MP) TaxID=391623 RepID=F0LJ06_THEBM|nr:hypothetical protein TERMP_00375 [Thermococcus barophilus MP]
MSLSFPLFSETLKTSFANNQGVKTILGDGGNAKESKRIS